MTSPFLTLTGIDEHTDPKWLNEILRNVHDTGLIWNTGYSAVEFGILRSPKAGDHPRFPDRRTVAKLLAAGHPGDFAFHLCGAYARMVEEGEWTALCDILDFDKVGRVQVNLPQPATDFGVDVRILNLWRFSVFIGRPVIMQWRGGSFPAVPKGLQLLQDHSGGKGQLAEDWTVPSPACLKAGTMFGYAGGLSEYNIDRQLNKMAMATGNKINFWVDCESSVRTGDKFDMVKAQGMVDAVHRKLAPAKFQPRKPEAAPTEPTL